MIQIKRVYDPPDKKDGFRILVDRLWPRGLSKERAKLNLWMKEIAPSEALRKWFAHDEKKWQAFRVKYRKELQEKKEWVEQLRKLSKENKTLTLLFGAKDICHNNAVVLCEFLKS